MAKAAQLFPLFLFFLILQTFFMFWCLIFHMGKNCPFILALAEENCGQRITTTKKGEVCALNLILTLFWCEKVHIFPTTSLVYIKSPPRPPGCIMHAMPSPQLSILYCLSPDLTSTLRCTHAYISAAAKVVSATFRSERRKTILAHKR